MSMRESAELMMMMAMLPQKTACGGNIWYGMLFCMPNEGCKELENDEWKNKDEEMVSREIDV